MPLSICLRKMVPTSEQGRQIFTQILQTNLDTVREILKRTIPIKFYAVEKLFFSPQSETQTP